MRITFVLPTVDLSGGNRVIATYAGLLKQRGHHIFCISVPVKKPSLKQQIKSLIKGKGLIPPPQPEQSHLESVDIIHKVIEKHRPITSSDLPDADVVIATWWETAEWVARLSKSKGAKAYFIQHHEVFNYLPVDRVKATWKLPLHKITIAQWLVDLGRDTYGDSEISLVPNGVDMDIFHAPPRNKQVMPTIGMLYANVYWKGLDICLKAFSLAAQKVPDLKLKTFGSYELADNLPLPPNATYAYTPPQSQIREIYSSCDAWLFGSRVEGFGLPILEAMACRTPVIATPVGAAPELLTDGGGILVEPENPESMAAAIVKLCNFSNEQWKNMSDIAYDKAKNYSWEEATKHFETALKWAIERNL